MAEGYRLLAQELQLDPSAQPVELLLNPLKTQVNMVGAAVETARSGPPRYDMHMQLRQRGDQQRVYGFSAFRHQDPAHDTCRKHVILGLHALGSSQLCCLWPPPRAVACLAYMLADPAHLPSLCCCQARPGELPLQHPPAK